MWKSLTVTISFFSQKRKFIIYDYDLYDNRRVLRLKKKFTVFHFHKHLSGIISDKIQNDMSEPEQDNTYKETFDPEKALNSLNKFCNVL